MTTTDYLARVARAIDYLGAVEVAPGRYALYDDKETHRWYITSADGVLDVFEPTGGNYREPQPPTEMPSWWTPEQREATRCHKCGQILFSADAPADCDGDTFQRITASLYSGEETSVAMISRLQKHRAAEEESRQ